IPTEPASDACHRHRLKLHSIDHEDVRTYFATPLTNTGMAGWRQRGDRPHPRPEDPDQRGAGLVWNCTDILPQWNAAFGFRATPLPFDGHYLRLVRLMRI